MTKGIEDQNNRRPSEPGGMNGDIVIIDGKAYRQYNIEPAKPKEKQTATGICAAMIIGILISLAGGWALNERGDWDRQQLEIHKTILKSKVNYP